MNPRFPIPLGLLVVAAAGLVLAPTAVAREMPEDPTEARSTADGYDEFVALASDFERIHRVQWGYRAGGSAFQVAGQIRLLSNDRRSYRDGLFIQAWLDADGDGVFDADERVVSTVRFPRGRSRLVGFRGSLDLGDQEVPATAALRVIATYAAAAGPAGEADFGDVKDFPVVGLGGTYQQPPVEFRVIGGLDEVEPGGDVDVTIEARENWPGALSGSLVFVSPKGTAVALSRSQTRVKSGNIVLGRLRGANRTVGASIRRRSTVASTIEIDLGYRVASDWPGGDLRIGINKGAGELTIAVDPDAHGGIRVEPGTNPLPTVEPGTDDQDVSPVIIRESGRGRLGRVIRLVSPKGTAVSLRRGGVRVRVRSGDILLGDVRVTDDGSTIEIDVDQTSTEPSEIEVTYPIDVEPEFTDTEVQVEVGTSDPTSGTSVRQTAPVASVDR